MTTLSITDIVVAEDRPMPSSDSINAMARSIEEIGMLNPITIGEHNELVAGMTRLQAAKKLGWTEVPTRMVILDDRKTEMATIIENLVRSTGTAAERAASLKRLKELYVAEHPETESTRKRGGPGRGKTSEKKEEEGSEETNDTASFVLPFTDSVAKASGKSRRSIERLVELAAGLTDAARLQITGTKVENTVAELQRLAALLPDQQDKVARLIGSGRAKTVNQAKRMAGIEDKPKTETKPGQPKRDHKLWNEIESLLGRALNRTDALHRDFPSPPLHFALLQQIKQAMETLATWKGSVND